MHRTGLILGVALFFGAIVEWVLRLAHYAELVEKTLPWTEHMLNPAGIWITMAVGILIFVAAWSERTKEKEGSDRMKDESGSERNNAITANLAQTSSPIVTQTTGPISQHANPTAVANPTQSVNVPVTVNLERSIRQPLPVNLPKKEPKHNVRCVGFKKYPSSNSKCVVACFRNALIPDTPLGALDYAKSNITFYNSIGVEILNVMPGSWMEEQESFVHIEGGETKCCIVAGYLDDKWWGFSTKQNKAYWDGVLYENDQHEIPLDGGTILASVTLIGEHGISLEPSMVELTLYPDGNFEFKQRQ